MTQCTEKCPTECQPLRYALFACKRGQVDARTRIQGNKGESSFGGASRRHRLALSFSLRPPWLTMTLWPLQPPSQTSRILTVRPQ